MGTGDISAIDLETLLRPVSAGSPCGEPCEYDPLFDLMEQAAAGKPERQMGDVIVKAEPPDWPQVRRCALELLSRSKDLRCAIYLCRALLHADGWPGLAQGLTLIEQLLKRYWQPLYPQLDPDDDDPALLRINCFQPLNHQQALLADLWRAPLIEAGAAGRFSLRDLAIVSGKLPAAAEEADELPSASSVQAAALAAGPGPLRANLDAITQAIESVHAISAELQAQLALDAPDMSPLLTVLGDAREALSHYIDDQDQHPATDPPADDAAGAPAAAANTPAPAAAVGPINSREQVLLALDQICDFYHRNEPSSPVPLLLQRAKKLVAKDFIAVLEELMPDAVAQAKALQGLESAPPPAKKSS